MVLFPFDDAPSPSEVEAFITYVTCDLGPWSTRTYESTPRDEPNPYFEAFSVATEGSNHVQIGP